MITYTKNDVAKMFEISRTTLYRHMEKNNIDKNSKLTDKEIAILKQSIRPTLILDEDSIKSEEHDRIMTECQEKYEAKLAICNEQIINLEAIITSLTKQNEQLIENQKLIKTSSEKLENLAQLIENGQLITKEGGKNNDQIETVELTEEMEIVEAEETINIESQELVQPEILPQNDLMDEVEETIVEQEETPTEETEVELEEMPTEETEVELEEMSTEETEVELEETSTEETEVEQEETPTEETEVEQEETVVEEPYKTVSEEEILQELTKVENGESQQRKKRWWQRR